MVVPDMADPDMADPGADLGVASAPERRSICIQVPKTAPRVRGLPAA
jgi:hypothetical protein